MIDSKDSRSGQFESRFIIPTWAKLFATGVISQIMISCQNPNMNNLDRVANILKTEYGCTNFSYATGGTSYRLNCPENYAPNIVEVIAKNPDLEIVQQTAEAGQVNLIIRSKIDNSQSPNTKKV